MHFSQRLRSALSFHRREDDYEKAESRGRSTKVQDTNGKQHSTRRSISHGLRSLLGITCEASDAFPPLKSTLTAVIAALNVYQRVTGNQKKALNLIERLETMQEMTLAYSDDKGEQERAYKLQCKLEHILLGLRQMSDQGTLDRILNNEYDEGKLSSCLDDLHEALLDYQISLQQDIQRIGRETIKKVDLGLLSQLPRAKDAGYSAGNRKKCLRGTRANVLQRIEDWARDPKNRRVYWLNGIAGSGKSTITQSFAEWCFAEGVLGASFFCSRDFVDRSNIRLIFPTIAFDLACRYPEFRAALIPVLVSSPNVGHESLSVQLQKLIIGPLKVSGLSTIIIIDALDECLDEEPASIILSLLARHVDEIPLVKFFITGRPEPWIRSGFRLPLLRPHTEVLLLHEVERASVDHDIRVYLKTRLSELVIHRSDVDLAGTWPEDDQLVILVQKSAGLFIFASTTYKFVASQHANPRDLLQLIVDMSESTTYEGASGIDPLYTRILDENYPVHSLQVSAIHERLQNILGTIVTAFNPLSRASMAPLLGISSGDIYTSLRHLHSLVRVPQDENEQITIFHKSFPDYLTDSRRCTNPHFEVDTPSCHAKLAIKCLEFMKKNLLQNLCGIPQYMLNRDVKDLSFRRKERISDTLEYACRFWAKHLSLAVANDEETTDILSLLKFFVEHRLLAWLEVLSIVGDLGVAVHVLNNAKAWISKLDTPDSGLLISFTDSERFVLRSFDVVQESASHVYNTALLWAPVNSLVRLRYKSQSKAQGKLLNPHGTTWDSCTRTIAAGSRNKSVTFSHNGDLIAVCGADGEQEDSGFLKLFDAVTGACLARLEVEGHVESVSFSPDDALLAAGSADAKITVWDVKTGSLAKEFVGVGSPVISVAFGPGGDFVTSASLDGSVSMWDIHSGERLSVIMGPSPTPTSISWSPINPHVASGFGDGTVHVWDALTGETRVVLGKHANGVRSVVYSPDGSKIASCDNSTIKLYDAESGNVLHTITTDKVLRSVAFSLNGDTIAYAGEKVLSIWDMHQEAVVANFECEPIASLSFAPDGNSLAAACCNRFVRVWETAGREHQGLVDHHTARVRCFAFSVDGKLMISGSDDCSVKLWNTSTGLCVRTFAGHSTPVTLVAFSPDNSLITSFASDESIRIWNRNTGVLLQTVRSGVVGAELSFSPDGRSVVVASDMGVTTLWSVQSGRRMMDAQLQMSSPSSPVGHKSLFVPNDHPPSPINHVPQFTEASLDARTPFAYSQQEGWVMDQRGRCICWIPVGLRTDVFKWYGRKLALGIASGRVVLFDFSEVI